MPGGLEWTFPAYLKEGTNRYALLQIIDNANNSVWAVFDLQGGTSTNSGHNGSAALVGSPAITSAGGGWYRVSVTGTLPNPGIANYVMLEPASNSTPSTTYSGSGSTILYFGAGATVQDGGTITSIN